jgi:tetratricopeptide (TPR) repeat protein
MKNLIPKLLLLSFLISCKSVSTRNQIINSTLKETAHAGQVLPALNGHEHDSAGYYASMQLAEYNSAITFLISWTQKQPEKNYLKDSLLSLFFYTGRYPSFALLAEKRTDTLGLNHLEMLAFSYEAIGNYKGSIELYERLLKQTNETIYYYEIAQNQYRLKRYLESEYSLNSLIRLEESSKEPQKVTINTNAHSEQVSLKAAAYNLLGVIHKELNQTEKAKTYFEASLKEEPQFKLALANMETLKK